jgi:uncharacterized protein DUF4389
MQATYRAAITPYPVRVEGRLDGPSRSLWLIKWLLALPHFVALAGLWVAFVVSSLAAFVAALFTGRYPVRLFDFNVGVMRWSWRVAFYAYGANGTDRYPPFTLGEVPDYPARLEVSYPEHQRRGLPLIGWWLAGIPQYLIVGVFAGGWALDWTASTSGGLIGLLVLVAAIVLLFRGIYPRSIFDLLLGLNRWVLRVVAYAAVMTPEYPPFRIDPGESDPAGKMMAVRLTAPRGGPRPAIWGTRPITATVLASIATLLGIAAVAAGGAATILDHTQRNPAGYLMTQATPYSTGSYALESDAFSARGVAGSIARDLLGTIRITAQSSRPVFVGIAPADAVDGYLAGVAHARVDASGGQTSGLRVAAGGAPITPPAAQQFWVATASGAGTRTLTWKTRSGNWRVVALNADGTREVASDLSIGATFPHLATLGVGALGAGILILLLSGAALYRLTRRRS